MCFSPQRRAIFQHHHLQKCSRTFNFLTFSLPNAFFTTAACHFSTSKLQKVLRGLQFFNIFTSECAFRHSGVQFWIYALTTWLCTRRFNRPTFRLTRHTNHWKNTAFRDFSNILARMYLLSLDFDSIASFVDWLDYSTAELCICFSTLHIVGSFYLNFLRLGRSNLFIYTSHDDGFLHFLIFYLEDGLPLSKYLLKGVTKPLTNRLTRLYHGYINHLLNVTILPS